MGVKISDDWGTTWATGIEWNDKNLRSHQRIAARFAAFAEGKAIYIHGGGWHYWDGARWAPDRSDTRTRQLLTELLKASWVESVSDKDLQSDVKAAMTANGSWGVLDLAKSHPGLFVEDTDTDPYLLNCHNGTLDLHTLRLRPHDPADRITKVTNASYDPDATSKDWDYLTTSSLPDAEVREFLQRYAGVGLIGRVLEHVLVILTGGGRNGKGMLARTIGKALGDYSITASNEMLVDADRGGRLSAQDLSSMYRLRGARWAVMSEIRKGSRLAEATMKSLTGGDEIEAKLMGKDKVEFLPSHSFIMLANDLPGVDPDAKAVWDRMRVVPFDVSFAGREDTSLEERLEASLEAVLAWCVAGLREYQQRRLDAPEAVLAKTDDYHTDNDPVGRFVRDQCVLKPNAFVAKAELAKEFTTWATEEGERVEPRALTRTIAALPGVTEGRTNAARKWNGIGLKSTWE